VIRELITAFVEIVLPVLLIGGIGYLVGRVRQVDIGGVSGLAVSVLLPAVVFDSLARAALPRDLLLRLALHVVIQVACLGMLAVAAARLLRWHGPATGALVLASVFPNAGNIGLPISLFAFGAPGLAVAGGWFAVSAIAVHTFGAFVAARAQAGARAALARLVRQPIMYAIAAGVLVNATGWPLPSPLAKASQLLAGGAVTMLLLLVGLQLARMVLAEEAPGALLATSIRLLAAPPVAWLTGRLIGLEGTPLAVAVLQAGMPTAVAAAMWAMEYDTRPALVSATVVLSTLAGVATLTLLVAALGARP
jgi:predicted permease